MEPSRAEEEEEEEGVEGGGQTRLVLARSRLFGFEIFHFARLGPVLS